jgi:hypothetical protein
LSLARFYIFFAVLCSVRIVTGQDLNLQGDSAAPREIVIPFSIDIYCENAKTSFQWDLNGLDSFTRPHRLHLNLFSSGIEEGEENDSTRKIIRQELLDSSYLSQLSDIWVSQPGYYMLDFLDTVKNIRYLSKEIKLDICSQYMLADHFHYAPGKLYRPIKNTNIEKIDLVIFNTLGNEVFETRNPEILWDGRDQNTGLLCPQGSYFFNCDVYEQKNGKIVKRNITGIVDLTY